ncbi:uncharacterized protein [Diadema antillarum]|uniref:uncharacterized protein n=1 Tax=Diadema antillarum TaxID=105358 RepID=UPI003A861792
MNPQHIPHNMGYLPLLAEEGLKIVNSYQGNVQTHSLAEYHQGGAHQGAFGTHYEVPDDGFNHQERMQQIYMGAGEHDLDMSVYNEQGSSIGQFNQPHYLDKHAMSLATEPRQRGRGKKNREGKQPRKRGRDPTTWKRNASKMKRNSGQSYVNSTGSLIPARQMREPCKNCRQKCPERISEEERKEIFQDFWDPKKDWTARRIYCIDHVVPQPIQRRRIKTGTDKKARRLSFNYHLSVKGEQVKVCKKFFLSTLAVGEKFVIISLHKKTVDGNVMPDRRGRHPAANQIPLSVKQDARRHIQAALQNREISADAEQQEQVNLTKMYETYVAECEMQQKEVVKKHFYRKLMNEELRITQQRLEGPGTQRTEERPLDYAPTPQVSALECLIKELRQQEEERCKKLKQKSNTREKLKKYHALRYAGKEYVNFKGQLRPSRKMKEPCENCQKECSQRISDTQRQKLFENFWDSSKDWNDKRRYVLSCMDSQPAKVLQFSYRRTRLRTRPGRPLRFSFFFEVDGTRQQVCRKFFINTLGLSHNFIASCIAKKDENGEFNPDKGKTYRTLTKIPPAVAKEVREHIIYNCWADPDKGREYQTHSSTKGWSWNVSKMYSAYREVCWMRGTKPASTYMYRRVFSEEMRVVQEHKVVVPSTPSLGTRSHKKSQSGGNTDRRNSTATIATEKPAGESAEQDFPNISVEGTELSEGEEEEKVAKNTAHSSREDDEDYVPSSEEEEDDSEIDGDDDSDGDANYVCEPTAKKGAELSTAAEPMDSALKEETMQDDLAGRSSPTQATPKPIGSKPKRRRMWDTADMRCAGQTYINDKGNVIPARTMKEPCQNCRKRCSEHVSPEMRQKIFNMFWSKEMSWEKKRQYVESCIEEIAVKTRTLPASQMKLNRKVHMKYTLRLGDWEQNVCKVFFVNTLGVSQKFAIVSLRKQKERLQRCGQLPSAPQQQHPLPPVTRLQAPILAQPAPQHEQPSDPSLRDVLSHLLLIPTSNSSE